MRGYQIKNHSIFKLFSFMKSLTALILFACASVLVSSCIRFSSPSQKIVKATSVVHLENKSSNWLFSRGDRGMGVSTETGLPDELNGSELWTYEIQGGGSRLSQEANFISLDTTAAENRLRKA